MEKSKKKLEKFIEEARVTIIPFVSKDNRSPRDLTAHYWDEKERDKIRGEIIITLQIIVNEGTRNTLVLAKVFLTTRLMELRKKQKDETKSWDKEVRIDKGDCLGYRRLDIEIEVYEDMLIFFNFFTKDDEAFKENWKVLHMPIPVLRAEDREGTEYHDEAIRLYERAKEAIKIGKEALRKGGPQ